MTQEQRKRLETIKEKVSLIQNSCNRVLNDATRAEEEADGEKAELLITLAEKELATLLP